MNNAFLDTSEEKPDDVAVRQRASELADVIEALQNISNSSFWKVLQKNVFDVELSKSKRRLETESDTTEIFRLQGEVKLAARYDLDRLIAKHRNELTALKKKIND